MPLFSVIIPAYNRADLIEQTLQSVLTQDFPAADLEIIVVDDGSTDHTISIVQKFAPRVQLLQQQNNKGPGAARNAGLTASCGEYAAFLDSDDFWFHWTASHYAAVIEKYDRPAFIAGKPFIFDPGARVFPTQPIDLQVLQFVDYYNSGDQWRWYSASSFVMHRQTLISAGGFTDEPVNGEDAEAAMRMGVAGKFIQILSPYTFAYRRHPGSAMANLDRSYQGIRRLIQSEQGGHFPGGEARALERRRIITTYARPLALSLLKNKPDLAWDLYRQTFMWQLALRRYRFLAAFPAKAMIASLIGHKPKPASN